MLDDIDDRRNDPPVIDPGNSMRKWEKWLDPAHLRLAKQEWYIHLKRLLDAPIESTNDASRKQFNGS
jgi:hypothetical protein